MKVSKVSVTSWHYRLRQYINTKSYINNWFLKDDIEIDSCSYWRAITHYLGVQVPTMILIGTVLGTLINAMILSMIYFVTFGVMETVSIGGNMSSNFLVGLGVCLWALVIIIFAVYIFQKISSLECMNKDVELSFIAKSIDALKNKYCFSIQYVDENNECVPIKAQDSDDIDRPLGFRMGQGALWQTKPYVSLGDGTYLPEDVFRLKYPEIQIKYCKLSWIHSPTAEDYIDPEKIGNVS